MDARQYAPATQRNREPILEVLSQYFAPKSTILEIASGTGEHSIFFVSRFKSWYWIPSDINPQARESIIAWKNINNFSNLAFPLIIDVTQENWIEAVRSSKIDGIVNINMIHIAPWSACLGLFQGASKLLSPGKMLYLYGPFKCNGEHTAISNAQFDRSLQERNPAWGVRNLETVIEVAAQANFGLPKIIEMPANNLSIIFTKLD